MESFAPTTANAPALTKEAATAAVAELFIGKFPRINRRLFDPLKAGDPKFVLISFVKATGAKADKDGFFGVAKVRGAFHTQDEASARAEEIIRDVDSTNFVNMAIMGAPIPLVIDPRKFAREDAVVDIQKKTEQAISDNVRAKRKEEEREMKIIKERAEALTKRNVELEKNDYREDVDEEEVYVQQRVKLSHLRYAIEEHAIKRIECIEAEKLTREFLRKTAAEHPEFEQVYLEKYLKARRDAHIPEETDLIGFMKFMADPIDYTDENPSYIS